MSTWATLTAEVQAQIDVPGPQAYAWLLDRARVMNAEASWLLRSVDLVGVAYQGQYVLPSDCVKTEALAVNGRPFSRSTLGALDNAKAMAQIGSTWRTQRRPIYADGVSASGANAVEIYPLAPDGALITVRFVADVPDDQTGSPPFPDDLQEPLVDGAIAYGLARMDERFDSAGYFDARFSDAVGRLRRRRNSHIGRGGTQIRVVT